MRQSLEILQATALELRQMLRQELEVNPVLEDETESVSLESAEEEAQSEDEEREVLAADDDALREAEIFSGQAPGRNREREERLAHLYDSITPPVTLARHLEDQLALRDLEPEVREAFGILLGSLDEKGYLTSGLEELALRFALPLRHLEAARDLLASLDPPGLGARDVRDCLLSQLERRGERDSLAWQIVDGYFELFARNRRPEIARALAVTVADVNDAAAKIATLDPFPARAFGEDENRLINPDVTIAPDGRGGWDIELNQEHIPHLRISPRYREMLADPDTPAEARQFIRERVRGGRFVIQCIEQRQQTLRRIATILARHQHEFLLQGPAHLRPMTMQQVAEEIGVHETTISRAIANKYIDTPQGVLEMRRFFTSGFQTADGKQVANTSVKDRVASLIAAEDPAKPLSDEAIIERLSAEGTKVARRTIAKYRKALGIPASHLRRQHG